MDPTTFELWRIPLAQWGLVQLVTGLTVALTPSQSVVRPMATAIVIALAYSFQSGIAESFADTRAGGPLAAMCWVNVLNAIDMLVLSRVSYEAQVEWEAKKGSGDRAPKETSSESKSTLFRRLLWSLKIAFNYRRINTPWQISRLPVFDRKNPQYVPSRLKFVLQGSGKICIAFLLVHLCTMDPSDPRLAGVMVKLSDSKMVLAPWWHGTPASVILAQAMTTISFGIVCRASIVGMYSLAGVLLVGLGFYDPVEWPPVANSLTEAWSLTRLWGTAWHQVFRTLLVSNADFISFSILRVPPKSRWACYPRVLFAFTVSGFIHMGMDLAFGVPRAKTGAVWFFCLQALGIMFESVVQSLFGARLDRLSPLVKRAVGYAWVGLFLLWATPVWLNPIMLCLYEDGQPAMSPVPIIGRLPL
ncbi:membrane bound O-acyl transferase family-domain-containing protein [Aspergillus bertholletiae]|uniref:Membrane bound O-acyl transferase family-domain-containing protein n=1 Tax=Aspergillus bertholletiae TaxID=1226010 RepID=A0A5N7AYW9_9EURO|nr:membrane bound O-acyl transferase family-domain-containing protein [Aspergillus bertholletiae]